MVSLSREELAWAAGFFDGEGCVGCYTTKRGYKQITLKVSQNGRELLERFRLAVAGPGQVDGPYRNTTTPIHQYQVQTFAKVQAIIAMLWPWLGAVKKAQAKKALVEQLAYEKA